MAPFVDLAAGHHERVDGSGYHRGITGDRPGLRGPLLAAADPLHAMTESRPHPPAPDPAQAPADVDTDAHPFNAAITVRPGQPARIAFSQGGRCTSMYLLLAGVGSLVVGDFVLRLL